MAIPKSPKPRNSYSPAEVMRDRAQREVERLTELLSHATEFTFRPDYGDLNDRFSDDPEHRDAVTVAYRGPAEKGGDPDRWAILSDDTWCWSRATRAWVYERSPSNWDANFRTDCRFSRDEAVALVPEILREIKARRIPELRAQVEARRERQQ